VVAAVGVFTGEVTWMVGQVCIRLLFKTLFDNHRDERHGQLPFSDHQTMKKNDNEVRESVDDW